MGQSFDYVCQIFKGAERIFFSTARVIDTICLVRGGLGGTRWVGAPGGRVCVSPIMFSRTKSISDDRELRTCILAGFSEYSVCHTCSNTFEIGET